MYPRKAVSLSLGTRGAGYLYISSARVRWWTARVGHLRGTRKGFCTCFLGVGILVKLAFARDYTGFDVRGGGLCNGWNRRLFFILFVAA